MSESACPSWATLTNAACSFLFRNVNATRLKGEIRCFLIRLETEDNGSGNADDKDSDKNDSDNADDDDANQAGEKTGRQAAKKRCIGFLEKAERAIALADIDSAWKCYNAARRAELHLLDDNELKAVQISLAHEAAQKLEGWRHKSVAEILCLAEDTDNPEAKRRLIAEALMIRDAHNDNLYFRKDRVRSRMVILAVFLLALLLLYLSAIGLGDRPFRVYIASEPISWELLASCMLLGGMGACLSALMSLSNKDVIPDQFTSIMVTIARPLIGAASGIIAVLSLKTGFFDLGDNNNVAVWLLAFALGFSERLVMGTMEKIGSKK